MKPEDPEAVPQDPTPADNGPEEKISASGEEASQTLEAARREAEILREQLLRKAAEFENYKRRIDGEFRSVIENATERLIVDLLPVLDDFDRLMKSANGETNIEVLRQGFELIANKLKKILSFRGLRPFESAAKPFDVAYHDALLQVPRSDVPPNTVVEEVSRGYMLNDRIIRHAKVIVSTSGADGSSVQPGEGDSMNGAAPAEDDA
jgi:molecular chaperone GrpE